MLIGLLTLLILSLLHVFAFFYDTLLLIGRVGIIVLFLIPLLKLNIMSWL